MAGKRRADEQESTYKWINSLKKRADVLGALVKGLEIMHHQARNRQVANSSVVAEIEAILADVRKIHGEVQGMWLAARAANRRIIDRVESPRKGRAVEANVDVSRAMRDVG